MRLVHTYISHGMLRSILGLAMAIVMAFSLLLIAPIGVTFAYASPVNSQGNQGDDDDQGGRLFELVDEGEGEGPSGCGQWPNPTGFRHSDGTLYCIRAKDLSYTASQIMSLRRAGDLESEIAKKSIVGIRTFPELRNYNGPIGLIDVSSLRDVDKLNGVRVYPVIIQIDAQDASLGSIEIEITVKGSASVTPPVKPPIEPPISNPPEVVDPPPTADTPLEIDGGGGAGTQTTAPSYSSNNYQPIEVASLPLSSTQALASTLAQEAQEREKARQEDSANRESSTSTSSSDSNEALASSDQSFLGTLFAPIKEQGLEGYLSAVVYLATATVIAPSMLVGIVTDIQVLNWISQKRASNRLGRNVLS